VAVVLVVVARDVGKAVHLPGREGAVGNRDPQHVGMELQVEAVHEPERLELILGHVAGQPARHLAVELRDALANQGLVEFVVAIHHSAPSAPRWWLAPSMACFPKWG
jgi:hypothetical protein